MRIVTRPDFDGIVCAVLLKQALAINQNIYWVEPHEIQSDSAQIKEGDILANLPYSKNCSLWFDHHISNTPSTDIKGDFRIAPSAAGVVYAYYQEKGLLDNRYDELVEQTDIIDSADLTLDQVRFPEKYPYVLLSMTVKNEGDGDEAYWNLLVDLFIRHSIDRVMDHPEVKQRCETVVKENSVWGDHLMQHTREVNQISITDFRSLEQVPGGNRFLTYSLFPDSIASVKIRFTDPQKEKVQISIGKSIFNRHCHINIGKLLACYGGGGHDGAGGCTLDSDTADTVIDEILGILYANKKEVS
jgi:hypothetical protein